MSMFIHHPPCLKTTQKPSLGHVKIHRSGFTLFEVGVSLLIVSFGVVSVLLMFPAGLKQLQIQRYQIYAATIASQLVDTYSNNDNTSFNINYEAPAAWEIPIDRVVNQPDLEKLVSTQRTGLMPLPREIALRLDSDGDEIKQLLDDGGQVYYLQPQAPNLFREDLMSAAPPNDLQKMIVGVVGNAQHNASFSFPGKRWPYYAQVPGPGISYRISPDGGNWPGSYSNLQSQLMWKDALNQLGNPNSNSKGTISFEALHEIGDTDQQAFWVMRACQDYLAYPAYHVKHGNSGMDSSDYSFSRMQGLISATNGHPDRAPGLMRALGRYLNEAMWFFHSACEGNTNISKQLFSDYIPGKHNPLNGNYQLLWDNNTKNYVVEVFKNFTNPSKGTIEQRAARAVLAMNYLTHALICFTGRYPRKPFSSMGTSLVDSASGMIQKMRFSSSDPATALNNLSIQIMPGSGPILPDGTIAKEGQTDLDLMPDNWVFSNLDDVKGTGGVDLEREFCTEGTMQRLGQPSMPDSKGRKPVFPALPRNGFPSKGDAGAFPNGLGFAIPLTLTHIFKNGSTLTHDVILRVHHQFMRHYLRFTYRFPYNWAVPRMASQGVMMDHPLLELDLFKEPFSTKMLSGLPDSIITAPSQQKAAQWKYMSPTTIDTLFWDVNKPSPSLGIPGKIGSSITYPGNKISAASGIPASNLGDQFSENGPPPSAGETHYTMLNAFQASERCRELVFWVADWQQYEDCETAPSAPVDGSKYLVSPPGYSKGGRNYISGSSSDRYILDNSSYLNRMASLNLNFPTDWFYSHYFNPERVFLFMVPTEPINGYTSYTLPGGGSAALPRPTGFEMLGDQSNLILSRRLSPFPDMMSGIASGGLVIPNGVNSKTPIPTGLNAGVDLGADQGKWEEIFCGRFGADRNGNHLLDRGPLRKSVRIRATSVARFNYYDLRAQHLFK